ncbi:peptidoglycan-binding protein [Rhodobacter sp. KR11]|uniref:peptidoglycan-binding protein n=1 Tax=Rhodobacter sp. KR11 TaxID=2974588 RepID=UPI0022230884|nr:peptidoglycan-binding protein [Rhodobacter sp. KR11]MCW1920554.1 peptidoglycan-binding protein [Rhodobacter sp. KR11]
MTLLKFLAAALLVAQGATAATTEGQFAMRGLGSAQCRAMIEAFATDQGPALRQSLGLWISGYVSGRNESQPDTFEVVPLQDLRILQALLEAACTSNPDALVQVTLSALVGKLDGARIRSAAAPLSIGDPPMPLHPEVLAYVQARLVTLGLMAPPQTAGSFDATTSAALQAFQGSVGLAPSGMPDDTTILMLLGQQ